jgi:ribosome-binding protein aMBF1 (putative translation factor)
MKKVLKPNPKYMGSAESEKKLARALERAFERDPSLQFEYDREMFRLRMAELVRSQRQTMRMTQLQLAKRIGVPQSFISRIEDPKSAKRPNLQTYAKVAKALKKRVVIQLVDEVSG